MIHARVDKKTIFFITTFLLISAMIIAPGSSLILNAKGLPLAGEEEVHMLSNPFSVELHYEEAKRRKQMRNESRSQKEQQRALAIQMANPQYVLGAQDGNRENQTTETDREQFTYWSAIARDYPHYRDAQLLSALYALRAHSYEDARTYSQQTEALSDPESDTTKLINTIKTFIPQK